MQNNTFLTQRLKTLNNKIRIALLTYPDNLLLPGETQSFVVQRTREVADKKIVEVLKRL